MDKKKIIVKIEENRILNRNKNIVAVYLFGSVAENRSGPLSDIDICIIANGIKWEEKLKIMSEFPEEYDISFFDDVPVWIKMRVLKGIPVIINNKDELYNIGFRTLHEYEDIKPLLRERMLRRFGRCTI